MIDVCDLKQNTEITLQFCLLCRQEELLGCMSFGLLPILLKKKVRDKEKIVI